MVACRSIRRYFKGAVRGDSSAPTIHLRFTNRVVFLSRLLAIALPLLVSRAGRDWMLATGTFFMSVTLSPLFTWRSAIVDDPSKLSHTTRLIALTLSLHMNERGGSCFPGIRRLAKESSTSRPTVIKHLRVLCDEGWLVRTPKAGGTIIGGRGQKTDAYTATIPEVVREVYQLSAQGGKAETPQVVNLTAKGGKADERHSIEDVIEDVSKDDRGVFSKDFIELWKAYPRKTAKQTASKAYIARRKAGDPADELLLAAQHYALSVKGTAEKYVLHGATFLGPDERWRDYLEKLDLTGKPQGQVECARCGRKIPKAGAVAKKGGQNVSFSTLYFCPDDCGGAA